MRTRPTTTRTRLAKAAATGSAALLSMAVLTPTAEARSPHQVDPALMVPALNPSFAPWSCFRTGVKITCQGGYEQTYENEQFGLQCDGQEVYLSGTARERMTRWQTAEGLATKTVVHLDFPGDTFSLSPIGEGPSLTISGHFNRHYTYLVPGDRGSRVLTEVGAIYLAKSPGGGGLVLHDTGSVRFEPGAEFDVIASMKGVHDVYSDPAIVDRVICDALT